MKTKNLLAPIVVLLAFAQALLGQDYMLPIGSNVDNHTTQVGVQITGYRQWVNAVHDYDPAMGPLKVVCQGWVKDLAREFVPVVGHEQDVHTLSVNTAAGPNAYLDFSLKEVGGNWVVPEDVINFEWIYSVQAKWRLQGVTNVTVNLSFDGVQVKHNSTSEGVGDTSCTLASAQSWLTMGVATVHEVYAYPWLKESWWDSGEVRFDAFDGFATFNILDGSLLDRSDTPPAFLAQLVRPTVPPKVSGLVLIDGVATIKVAPGTSKYFTVEYSTDFSGTNWSFVAFGYADATPSVSHEPPADAPMGFYRVRSATAEQIKAYGAKTAGKSP